MSWDIALLAVGLLAVAAASGRLSSGSVTAPMAFVVVGLLLGPLALGWFELSPLNRPGLLGDFWPWKQGGSRVIGSRSWEADESEVFG